MPPPLRPERRLGMPRSRSGRGGCARARPATAPPAGVARVTLRVPRLPPPRWPTYGGQAEAAGRVVLFRFKICFPSKSFFRACLSPEKGSSREGGNLYVFKEQGRFSLCLPYWKS